MSHVKREVEEREQAQHYAAKRDGRRCPYCDAIIPCGTDAGPHDECPACVGALKGE